MRQRIVEAHSVLLPYTASLDPVKDARKLILTQALIRAMEEWLEMQK